MILPVHRNHQYCMLSALFFSGACSSSEGEGTVTITAYGESFIEDGIPADEMDDGWSVSFSRFDVSIEDVTVGGASIEVDDAVDVSRSSDGAGHVIGSSIVREGDHTGPGFSITRVEVEGSAIKDDVTKTFSWVFDEGTLYSACETTTSVEDGGSSIFQITIHADHLFYDSLVAEEPQLLFQALADADADDDGAITEVELSAADVGAYDPGSDGDADNLWTFLVAQTRTLGHADGEGHCETSSAD